MLQRIASNKKLEFATTVTIILNAFFIGIETQYVAARAEDSALKFLPLNTHDSPTMIVFQFLFCIVFTAELTLRWAAAGPTNFFLVTDRWWNTFDVFVVLMQILDAGFVLVSASNDMMSGVSVMRVLRVVRLARIAKVIRVMTFFRELRMMIFSIIGSLKTLLWVVVVLGMLIYLFAISLTSGTIAYLETGEMWRAEEHRELRNAFASVTRSVLSLFMAITGGNDWSLYYDMQYEVKAIRECLIGFADFTEQRLSVISDQCTAACAYRGGRDSQSRHHGVIF